MSYKVEDVTSPVQLGEGPHWDADQKCLFFVSIFDHTIHKYVPATKTSTSTKLSGKTSFIIPIAGLKDHFAVSIEREVFAIKWDGTDNGKVDIIKKIAEVDTAKNLLTNRLNDGKADPRGRLYAGTMGRENPPGKFEGHKGTLYSFDDKGAHECVGVDKVTLSGGLCWDRNANLMYYIDSLEYDIRVYDYNMDTAVVSNQKVIFRLKEDDVRVLPAGMTIDTDGNLWVACFEGSKVIQIDSKTHLVLRTIDMPVAELTSVAFGGENLDELYVTSGKTQEVKQPKSGALFKITGLGVKGFAGESCNFVL